MNTYSDIEDDEAEMNRLLSDGLAAGPVPARTALRSRLLARVGTSLAALAGVAVVRGREGIWRAVKAGVRAKSLWRGGEGNSVLIELAPGAELPVHRHAWREEGLILAGGLQIGDLDLGRGDYHLAPPGSRHGRMRSDEGCLAYLRGTSLGNTGALIGELVGGLLPGAGPAGITVLAGEGAWQWVAPGVEQKLLWQEAGVASRLLRLQPGAGLPARDPAGDEECMMIDGDAYFDDLLLGAGDFLRAPAGTRHGALASDGGALCFLRGASGEMA